MIRYILRKIKNDQSPVFNRWFAYPVVEEILIPNDINETIKDLRFTLYSVTDQ